MSYEDYYGPPKGIYGPDDGGCFPLPGVFPPLFPNPPVPATPVGPLPIDSAARKEVPIVSGVVDYFPDALAEIARVSKAGNDQHNPGEPLHWSKHKSADHADCVGRHLVERGTRDVDGQRHSAKLAWRALALLQTELEAERAQMTVRDYIKYLQVAAESK